MCEETVGGQGWRDSIEMEDASSRDCCIDERERARYRRLSDTSLLNVRSYFREGLKETC